MSLPSELSNKQGVDKVDTDNTTMEIDSSSSTRNTRNKRKVINNENNNNNNSNNSNISVSANEIRLAECIPLLEAENKNRLSQENIKEGDLVIIYESVTKYSSIIIIQQLNQIRKQIQLQKNL